MLASRCQHCSGVVILLPSPVKADVVIALGLQVLESWRLISRGSRGIKISLEDVRIYAGDTDAFLTCVEVIDAANERGRQASLHHTSQASNMCD